MKILLCGSRKWLNQKAIERELDKYSPGILVHGKAPGADNIGGYVAKLRGWEVRVYPARWDLYDRGAGPIRNQEMLDKEHPDADGLFIDLALAFHEDPNFGVGTRDMLSRLREADPPILIETFRR